jgi:glycosyltransferase involved in cell wall biosynthesis
MMRLVEHHAVDMFLPVSNAAAAGNGLIGSRLPFRVIPCFLPDAIAELPEPAHAGVARLPAEDFLLFVGDLRRDKGLDVLLQAYASLPYAPPLVLIGRPGRETPTALPYGVSMFHSWPHDAIMHAWSRSLLAVVPSLTRETFGLVAAEAMACGRPVVASSIGGLPDVVVDGETGLLVPPGDAASLRQALDALIRDRDRRERMGRAAQRHAREFSASAVVPRIEQTYEQVLAGSARVSAVQGKPMPLKATRQDAIRTGS